MPVLGAAGLSLTLASAASAATGAPVADVLTPNTGASHQITLSDEEVSDVSLATFYVFNKEDAGAFRPGIRLAMGMRRLRRLCRLRRLRLLDRHLLHVVGVRKRCVFAAADQARAQIRARAQARSEKAVRRVRHFVQR